MFGPGLRPHLFKERKMKQIIYQFTRAELEAAYNMWGADYRKDPTAYADYDDVAYDISNYGKESADVMIKYLEKVKEKK